MRIREKLAWGAAGVLALFVVASIAGEVAGGPLDPPGTPSSTMKTLADIPGSWNRELSSSGGDACNTQRFTCVFGGSAVLDNETGLVWERGMNVSAPTFTQAIDNCHNFTIVSDRKGWRLPAAHELASLIDTTGTPYKLPAGHPFLNIEFVSVSELHWTSTSDPANAANALTVTFGTGTVAPHTKGGTPPDFMERVICVRSGDHP